MYKALPMLNCKYDNYSSFYWILTIWSENLGEVRRWAIQLKGGGNGGGRKISFTYNSVTIEDRKKS